VPQLTVAGAAVPAAPVPAAPVPATAVMPPLPAAVAPAVSAGLPLVAAPAVPAVPWPPGVVTGSSPPHAARQRPNSNANQETRAFIFAIPTSTRSYPRIGLAHRSRRARENSSKPAAPAGISYSNRASSHALVVNPLRTATPQPATRRHCCPQRRPEVARAATVGRSCCGRTATRRPRSVERGVGRVHAPGLVERVHQAQEQCADRPADAIGSSDRLEHQLERAGLPLEHRRERRFR
jgi:hypothetical protein